MTMHLFSIVLLTGAALAAAADPVDLHGIGSGIKREPDSKRDLGIFHAILIPHAGGGRIANK